MLDFKNGSVFKLKACPESDVGPQVAALLIEDEVIVASFKSVRDLVVFTDKRIVTVNVQGISGKKRDYTSLPFSKVQAFSVETAGTLDLDAELELWFSGLGRVRLEFKGEVDIRRLGQQVARYTL